MNLKKFLKKKQGVITDRWFARVLETYPLEVQTLFHRRGDRFANPVGTTIFECLDGLVGELTGEGDPEKIRTFLDGVLRIRAIQDFSPSRAVVFLPLLKGVLKEEIGETVRRDGLFEEWLELESRIDDFLLLAFDLYTECREKIHRLRHRELRGRAIR